MLSEDMAEAAGREYPILDKIYEDQTVIKMCIRDRCMTVMWSRFIWRTGTEACGSICCPL